MTAKRKPKVKVIPPSETENAAIQAGIDADPDTFELTDEYFERARPARETHPDIVEDFVKRTRGPQKAPTKVPVSIRLSPKVLRFFRSTGKGWQSRLSKVLDDYVDKQS